MRNCSNSIFTKTAKRVPVPSHDVLGKQWVEINRWSVLHVVLAKENDANECMIHRRGEKKQRDFRDQGPRISEGWVGRLKSTQLYSLGAKDPRWARRLGKCGNNSLQNWVNDLQFLTRILTSFKEFCWPKVIIVAGLRQAAVTCLIRAQCWRVESGRRAPARLWSFGDMASLGNGRLLDTCSGLLSFCKKIPTLSPRSAFGSFSDGGW